MLRERHYIGNVQCDLTRLSLLFPKRSQANPAVHVKLFPYVLSCFYTCQNGVYFVGGIFRRNVYNDAWLIRVQCI